MNQDVPQVLVKRVYDPPEADDGARVLVDRLWPRGIRKDAAVLTLWLKEIAPSPELRRWFDHDPKRYPEFARRYRAELAQNGGAVDRLLELVQQGPTMLLYAARDQTHNHALVLAGFLREHLKGCNDQQSS